MMSKPLTTPGAQPQSAIGDTGLRCLNCEYNLTGLTEDRCPECNTPFVPELMDRVLGGAPFPVPAWDDPAEDSILIRFVRTCWMVWFRPVQFATVMPWSFHGRSVVAYWLLVRVAAILVLIPGWVIEGTQRMVVMVLVLFVFSIICESLLAVLLATMLPYRIAPPWSAYRFARSWWVFVAYFSSFLIPAAGAWPLSVLAMKIQGTFNPPVHMGSAITYYCLVVLLWWGGCLAQAVSIRAVSGWRLTLVRCLIPLVGFGSGLLAVMICAHVCRWLGW
ncbi:MAG: hypothetical protein GXY55_17145 [Phycisphaerae bacterium]|nr:hypothetical protein [Phycisphaerae bacterium]